MMRSRRTVTGLALAVSAAIVCSVAVARNDTGPLVTTVALGPDPGAMAVDEQTGHVFVADHVDGYLRVLDADSGARLRTITIGHDGPMAIDERRGLVFVAGAVNGPDNYGVYNDHAIVRVFDAGTGNVVRTVTTQVSADAVAMAVDSSLSRLFVLFPGTVLVLDAQSGAVLRTVTVGRFANLLTVDTRAGHVFVVSSDDHHVNMLDARRGAVLRTIEVGAGPAGVATDERAGHVFVATGNGVDVLDARSGALWRTVRAGHQFDAVAVDALAGRAFVVSAADGTVSTLDTHSGAVVRIVRAGSAPHVVAADEPAGRVFVGSQGLVTRANPAGVGSVRVLDAESGAVLRTIGLGDVSDLAVDERSGRAFVISRDYGAARASDPWAWLPAWLRSRLPWAPPPPMPRTTRVTESLTILRT